MPGYGDFLFAKDTRSAMLDINRDRVEAEKARENEGFWTDVVGQGLGWAGFALGGPIGYGVGKVIGKIGVDAIMDSESEDITPGKFYGAKIDDYNKMLKDFDKESDIADYTGIAMDTASTFLGTGGLEAIEAQGAKGALDKDAWLGENSWVSNLIKKLDGMKIEGVE